MAALLCCGGGAIGLFVTTRGGDQQSGAVAPRTTPPLSSTEPAPTITSHEQSSPRPSDASRLPTATVQSFAGRGAKVVRFTKDPDRPALATVTHRGSSDFALTSVDAQGQHLDLLVNEVGHYQGTLLVRGRPDERSAALRIEADGAWTVQIKSVASARPWNGSTVCVGRGDDVMLVQGAFEGKDAIRVAHSGRSNFVVYAVGEHSELLVNEIGPYSGEQVVPRGTALLAVNADGDWTMKRA